MSRVLILGNSGSGKSTLARKMCESRGLAHLDLDMLAWKASSPPEREILSVSARAIDEFILSNRCWVIEGCYTDLLELAVSRSTELIFMNLPAGLCVANARARPWEPHKYASKPAQDANLPMLIEWIREYVDRDDTFSLASHSQLYEKYPGKKIMVTRNSVADSI
jgi:adenylate kinase family enzyme